MGVAARSQAWASVTPRIAGARRILKYGNRWRTLNVKIYWIKAQAPQRVLALVKYLGIKTEFFEVDLMAGGLQVPEFAAINPNKKVPVLVDGDQVLWESSSIMAYLCIKAGSDMWPTRNAAEQVEVQIGRAS